MYFFPFFLFIFFWFYRHHFPFTLICLRLDELSECSIGKVSEIILKLRRLCISLFSAFIKILLYDSRVYYYYFQIEVEEIERNLLAIREREREFGRFYLIFLIDG